MMYLTKMVQAEPCRESCRMDSMPRRTGTESSCSVLPHKQSILTRMMHSKARTRLLAMSNRRHVKSKTCNLATS
jgi:hypothetical protein